MIDIDSRDPDLLPIWEKKIANRDNLATSHTYVCDQQWLYTDGSDLSTYQRSFIRRHYPRGESILPAMEESPDEEDSSDEEESSPINTPEATTGTTRNNGEGKQLTSSTE